MNGPAALPPANGGIGEMSYLMPALVMSAIAHGPETRKAVFLLVNSGIAVLSSIERLSAPTPFSPMSYSFWPAAIDSGESTVTTVGSGSPVAVRPKNDPPPEVKTG